LYLERETFFQRSTGIFLPVPSENARNSAFSAKFHFPAVPLYPALSREVCRAPITEFFMELRRERP
jgi:hypothetical protein